MLLLLFECWKSTLTRFCKHSKRRKSTVAVASALSWQHCISSLGRVFGYSKPILWLPPPYPRRPQKKGLLVPHWSLLHTKDQDLSAPPLSEGFLFRSSTPLWSCSKGSLMFDISDHEASSRIILSERPALYCGSRPLTEIFLFMIKTHMTVQRDAGSD